RRCRPIALVLWSRSSRPATAYTSPSRSSRIPRPGPRTRSSSRRTGCEYPCAQAHADAHAHRRGQPCGPALGAVGWWVARWPATYLGTSSVLPRGGARLDLRGGCCHRHLSRRGLQCGILLGLQPLGLSLALATHGPRGLVDLRRRNLGAPARDSAGHTTLSRGDQPTGRQTLTHATLRPTPRTHRPPPVGHTCTNRS